MNEIVRASQLRDGPDLAPSDCWLFGHMKVSLAGQVFERREKFPDGLNGLLSQFIRV
jgi:hypothetical protein